MAVKLSERRSELDKYLRSIVKQRCGSENVYYQPPANLQMKYPCIRYELNKLRNLHANDKVYRQTVHYTITVIDPKPDSELRVFMAWKPLGRPQTIEPQTFASFERNGFTVVEWGGCEVK